MASRLSGVDAIGPAFERTKNQLFVPFRFKYWLRLAVVCILTGEGASGGGGGSGFQGFSHINYPPPHGGGRGDSFLLALPDWLSSIPAEVFFWGAVAIIAVALFVLLIIYISSVYRFILFDSVLNNQCALREGWRRWHKQGVSYFCWQIGLGFVSLAAMAVLVGIPALFAWRAGWFRNPDKHIAGLIICGIGVFFVFLAATLLIAIISLFTKDFVVPVMALEGRGAMDSWRQLLPMLDREKGGYAFYVIMKIVLAIGSALIFGIIEFMVVFMIIILAGLAGVAAYFIAKGAGATWNPLTIALAVVAGGAIILLLVAVTAFISTPAMVFFQSYSLHFFGSRYPALGTLMAPPEPPPAPPEVLPPPEPLPAT